MTRTRCLIVCCLLLGGAGLGCRPPERKVQNLVLTGSSGMTPLLRDMGKRFEESHPDVHVDVQARGSASGAADARQGLADIGMVARTLKPDETMLHATAIAR
ncbi:MAG TPA: substrate-binding domain-containing protein, partial [Gemmataceae bacterium]